MPTCRICGEEFESVYVHAVYCSPSCRREGEIAYQRGLRARQKAERTARKKIMAERVAARAARREAPVPEPEPVPVPEPAPVPEPTPPAASEWTEGMASTERTCAVCGRTFSSRVPHAKYCGLACQEEAARRRMRKATWGAFEPVNRVCENCGHTFLATHPNMKLCSPKCREEQKERLRSRAVTKTCTECGAEFQTTNALRTRCRRCMNSDEKSTYRHAPTRRCHDCKAPCSDYRCPSCLAKWRRKHGVNVTDVWEG